MSDKASMRAYATIERSRFGWWSSYHTKSTNGLLGMDYVEMNNFAFTQRGIERKARRRINRLQKSFDYKAKTYEFFGDSSE